MVYLDYSATTPVNDEVLDSFVKANKEYIGNPNSLHKLGVDASHLIQMATDQITSLLSFNDTDIIYTSGSSEANNLAIKGIAFKYQNRGKHIITTPLEHSSIYGPLDYLKTLGFEVSYAALDEKGAVDVNDIKNLMREDTILVSVNAVNSELGIINPIKEIGDLLKDYPKCYFHVDATQAIGKIKLDYQNVDLVSFSAHKFYGLKGIGVLAKKKKIALEPLIHGGKSTTIYRSGTPSLPLIVSLAKALRLCLENNKEDYVKSLNDDLRTFFEDYDKVVINSPKNALPHILNISVLGVKPESFLHALEEGEVYLSTKSACANTHSMSEAVYAVTHNKEAASSSLRISLSYLTTKDEIARFKEVFDSCYNELTKLR